MGLLNGRADNKAQYIQIWGAHVSDLKIMYRAAGIQESKAAKLEKQQLDLVHIAAEREFPAPTIAYNCAICEDVLDANGLCPTCDDGNRP